MSRVAHRATQQTTAEQEAEDRDPTAWQAGEWVMTAPGVIQQLVRRGNEDPPPGCAPNHGWQTVNGWTSDRAIIEDGWRRVTALPTGGAS